MEPHDVIDAEFHAPAIIETQQSQPALFGTTDPVESIGKMVAVADALKAILVSKQLVSNIQGKEYVRLEGWQVLAGMLRISSIIEWTRPVDGGGWECRCVVRDPAGNEIGAGEGQCTRDERVWAKRDDYALRAMAQTRASSRALRNVLGFVVTLAGFQATPADEMPKDEPKDEPTPRRSTLPAESETARKQRALAQIRFKEAGITSPEQRYAFYQSAAGYDDAGEPIRSWDAVVAAKREGRVLDALQILIDEKSEK